MIYTVYIFQIVALRKNRFFAHRKNLEKWSETSRFFFAHKKNLEKWNARQSYYTRTYDNFTYNRNDYIGQIRILEIDCKS